MSTSRKPNSLGIALTQARLTYGYTQQEIATITGVSRSTYCHIECGDTVPSIHLLLRLCILYKENPVTYLLQAFPEDQLLSQKCYIQYLNDLSRIKYRPDNKRTRRRKPHQCWSRN